MAETVVDKMLARFRVAHPGVRVTDRQLRARVGELWSEASEDILRTVHLADVFITTACVLGDPSALADFERDYLGALNRFAGHLLTTSDDGAEVRGRLRERLLIAEPGHTPKLALFDGRIALRSWLRLIAERLLSNKRRHEKRNVEFTATAHDASASDMEEDMLIRRYRDKFHRAFRAGFVALTREERALLRSYWLEELSIDQLGELNKVHRATAARWIKRCHEQVLAHTMSLLQSEEGFTHTELEAMIPQLAKDFAWHIEQILGTPMPSGVG